MDPLEHTSLYQRAGCHVVSFFLLSFLFYLYLESKFVPFIAFVASDFSKIFSDRQRGNSKGSFVIAQRAKTAMRKEGWAT